MTTGKCKHGLMITFQRCFKCEDEAISNFKPQPKPKERPSKAGPKKNYVIDVTCTEGQLKHIVSHLRMIRLECLVKEVEE